MLLCIKLLSFASTFFINFIYWIILCVTCLYNLSSYAEIPGLASEKKLAAQYSKLEDLFLSISKFNSFYIPKTSFYQYNHQETSLKYFYGKRIILYFWSSWCRPCLQDLEHLSILKQELQFRHIDDVEIIAVSIDFKNIEEIAEKYLSQKITLDLFYDKNRRLYGDMRVTSLPTTFLINRKSQVIFGFMGSVPFHSTHFIDMLHQYLP